MSVDPDLRARVAAAQEEIKRDLATLEAEDSSCSSYLSYPEGWPRLAPEALYGLAGDFVRTVEPHSEADPVALLATFLSYFGNAVGPAPYYLVESDRHHCNTFQVLSGETSRARKGVSEGRVRAVFRVADPDWTDTRVVSGLSSGEGVVHAVRDRVEVEGEVLDPGEPDKRLQVSEGEFASVLRVLDRDGNTLSAVLRNAWDSKPLRTLTKHKPAVASDPHISVLAHITRQELRRYFTEVEAANGFGNRIIWLAVHRSKLLPEGGSLSDDALNAIGARVRRALEFGRKLGSVKKDGASRAVWARVYPELTQARPGLLGALVARSEAQVTRLALIYAVLDCSSVIRAEHLEAALAFWDYAEASAEYIFGDALGDPIADEIAAALRRAGAKGMTRTQISNALGRNRKSDQIGRALDLLQQAGRAESVRDDDTGGRPAECWLWTGCERNESDEQRGVR